MENDAANALVLQDRADQSAPTPDWLFDVDRRVMIDANLAAVAFWGAASREELLRRGFAEEADGAGRHLHDMIGRLHQGQSVEGLWTFYPCGEARMARCRCRPARLGDGRMAVRVTILPTPVPAAADTDTEARRWSEAACHAPFLVSLFTVAGICLMRNPAAARGLDGVPGLFDHVVDPIEAARLRTRVTAGEAVIATVPVNTATGAAWHEIHARLVRDPASGEAMVLVHEIDVTARRQAEDKLDAARLVAEAAGQVRSEFLAMLNHEIRTPMNGVLGALEVLDDTMLDAGQRDYLQAARQSAQGLLGLIDGLLDFSRLKSGKDQVEERAFDPASLLRRTRDGSSASSAEPVGDAVARAARLDRLTVWASERHDRILVVDDSPTNRMVAAAMLRKAGFEVLLASGGAEAVALAADTPVDLILMDIAMPGMDGLVAAGAIRALPGAVARVPIIAMTANGLTEDRARCRAAGMDDYLLKPFQKIDLLEVIARWLAEAPAIREAADG